MRAILFERKMINQGTAGDAFQKKLTVNDYRNAAQAITRHQRYRRALSHRAMLYPRQKKLPLGKKR